MDDSVRCLSSSSSPPPNPRSLHHEADENDQMLLKNQNPKGPPMKHFMAPTISAASKVAVLRKKILTERNESLDFSETHHQNTSNLVPKASPVHLHSSLDQAFSPKIASQKRISENLGLRINESEDNEHNSQFSDSSSKPYDPLTNYLSPRPKFLRYNPNRCREIFLRRESDIEKEIEGFDGQSSSVSPSLESSDEIEKVGIDILHEDDDHGLKADDEEIEDFENEGCLTLKGVFKFLLVSVVLLLLTWYISSMNSSESSPTIHLIRGLTAGYINGSNRAYDIAEFNSNWEDFIKRIDEKQKGINEFFNHMRDEGSGIESDSCDQSKGIEIPDSTEKPETFQDDQIPITPDLMSNYAYTNGAYHELETELEGVDHKKRIENSEPEDKSESFEEYEMPPLSDLVDRYVSKNEAKGKSVSSIEGISVVGDGKVEENGRENVGSAEDLVDRYVSKNEAKGKSVSLDRRLEIENEIETIEGISVVGDGKVEENGRENVVSAEDGSLIEFPTTKHLKYNQIYGAFIGIFLIIASSTLVFHLRCKRTPIVKSQPIGKSPYNPFSAENISSEDPLFPNMEEAHTAKVKSYPIPSAYFPTVEENTKDFPLTRAPTVELLGEFVVGEVQSSMKSCTKKTKAIEVKTKKMEFQAESKSIFVDKAVNRSAPLSTPELSAPTNMLSPLYGSSTTAKKKEDGSVKSTPVRRSSRIRNRAMSP